MAPGDIGDRLTNTDRLAAVTASGLLDTPADPVFELVAGLARRLLSVPTAVVALVDDRRVVVVGTAGDALGPVLGSADIERLCREVVAGDAPVVVPDVARDERTGSPAPGDRVAAFVGVPLRTPDGLTVGVVAAIDLQPRAWDAECVAALTELASLVGGEVSARGVARRVRTFAAEVDHRLRTPVAALELQLGELVDRPDLDPAARAAVAAARLSIGEVATVVHTLDGSVRRVAFPHERAVDLGVLLADRVRQWRSDPRSATRPVHLPAGQGVVVRVDVVALTQVLDAVREVLLAHGEGPLEVRVDTDTALARVSLATGGPPLPAEVGSVLLRRQDHADAPEETTSLALATTRGLGGRLVIPPAGHPVVEVVLRRPA